MNRKLLSACLVAGLACSAFAQPPAADKHKDAAKPQPGGAPAMQLPPGVTEADMAACTLAATPGSMHEHLAKAAGTWSGKNKMWMSSEMKDPVLSDSTTVVTPIMDGRFVKVEASGDMMGMPFSGLGINGYDNVSQKFQSTWIDNCGTTMMTGTGTLSADGKTMTWIYNYTCPITKKPVTMRQVEHITGENTMTLEMFGADPHTGKEFKMIEIANTRTGDAKPMMAKPMAKPAAAPAAK